MKILLLFVLTIGLLPKPVFAKDLTVDTPKSVLKKNAVEKLTLDLGIVDRLTNHLSATVSILPSGMILSDTIQAKINHDLDSIEIVYKNLKGHIAQLYNQLNGDSLSNCHEHFNNFDLQYGLMRDKVTSLVKNGDTVYSAQIDYTENGISSFITTTNNFKQYLLSLIPAPLDNLLDKIKERLTLTDTNVNSKTKDLKADITGVDKKVEYIISLLSPKINGNQFASISAYNRSVFGISYLHRVGKTTPDLAISHLGAEVLLPFDKVNAKNPGAFILYGLRYDKILIEAGAGYFKNTRTADNVSWKFGLLFVPAKAIGIGIAYSPLTGAGLQLAYRW